MTSKSITGPEANSLLIPVQLAVGPGQAGTLMELPQIRAETPDKCSTASPSLMQQQDLVR